MIYLQLFWEFFKTGLFAVGGGLATLPFLRDISLKYPWFTPNDLLDMIAVSESTPGPLGVNASTYAGFHAAGFGQAEGLLVKGKRAVEVAYIEVIVCKSELHISASCVSVVTILYHDLAENTIGIYDFCLHCRRAML